MKDKSHAEYQVLLTELEETLSDRTETAIAARIELRDAVCRYVDAEQTRGTTLAIIISCVREILAKAEARAGNTSTELAQQLVDWCRQFHGKFIATAAQVS